ncbi:cupin domain-containing protein [Paenibacillus sacheonensis]|uniref:Cupin domain-containing protein n=1 Tax=Paenibacillus sacheonensis TaxID=742054 RepID=A0A7X4YJT4_9BACL|nr:cupin domain-containing protein [Paenibacillus sacheonensis]MBM7563937.1 oxalate decarboxylase/phosphoglucose isomerase-like protein (cupin superfamily) [Paenibacillus sacheonensis]NBC67718.1 cupin domain-containing protein [Paenibacillus sacheonensis]
MAVSYMDYTAPNVQFTYDLKNNNFFTKDPRNLINGLSINQLNTLGNVSLLDIYLSTGNVVEPHIHQNASELVYCISGAAVVSLINPFTKQLLNFPIQPGQVANVPQGWWHYEIATADNTHLLAIFDAPVPEFIPGSDLLRLTPASVYAHTYCLDEATWKAAVAPITKTVVIGPPVGCQPGQVAGAAAAPQAQYAQHAQQAQQTQQGAHYPQNPYGQREQPAFGYARFPAPVIGNGWDYGNFNG